MEYFQNIYKRKKINNTFQHKFSILHGYIVDSLLYTLYSYYCVSKQGKRVNFCWISSHIGILEKNEASYHFKNSYCSFKVISYIPFKRVTITFWVHILWLSFDFYYNIYFTYAWGTYFIKHYSQCKTFLQIYKILLFYRIVIFPTKLTDFDNFTYYETLSFFIRRRGC